MKRHIVPTNELVPIEANLINVCLALEGLSQLLEEASNSNQNQTHQISCGNAILRTIIMQAHETTDLLTTAGPLFKDQSRLLT